MFCLGAPHLGADLEKGTNALAWALAKLPETRSLAGVLNARSVGIKDLRFGSCADEDWCDCDPDEFLRDRCQEVPFLPGAHYYFVKRWVKCSAIFWCACRAPPDRATAAVAASPSGSNTCTMSPACTISTCSTTRRYTGRCTPGSPATTANWIPRQGDRSQPALLGFTGAIGLFVATPAS